MDYHSPRVLTDSWGRRKVLPSILDSLLSKADISAGPDGCWTWIACRNAKGYGRLTINGSGFLAHRLSYEAHVGPVPGQMCICHRCDNPPCINPAHLFLGTQADNSADMVAKGRATRARNEKSGMAKLSDGQVAEMRRRRVAGESCESIAIAFDVSAPHVSRVTRGLRRPGEDVDLVDSANAATAERRGRYISLRRDQRLSVREAARHVGVSVRQAWRYEAALREMSDAPHHHDHPAAATAEGWLIPSQAANPVEEHRWCPWCRETKPVDHDCVAAPQPREDDDDTA
jgi:hypothetical protein